MFAKIFTWIANSMVVEKATFSSVSGWIVGVGLTALACVGVYAIAKTVAKKYKQVGYKSKKRG